MGVETKRGCIQLVADIYLKDMRITRQPSDLALTPKTSATVNVMALN